MEKEGDAVMLLSRSSQAEGEREAVIVAVASVEEGVLLLKREGEGNGVGEEVGDREVDATVVGDTDNESEGVAKGEGLGVTGMRDREGLPAGEADGESQGEAEEDVEGSGEAEGETVGEAVAAKQKRNKLSVNIAASPRNVNLTRGVSPPVCNNSFFSCTQRYTVEPFVG